MDDAPDLTAEFPPLPRPAKPQPAPKGVYCPSCRGTRLLATHTRKPCPGKTVRYRVCARCLSKVITEETIAKDRRPRGPKK